MMISIVDRMQITCVKDFEQAEYERLLERAERTGFPVNAVVKPHYNDKTANGLTKLIIAYCRAYGWHAERINTQGRVLDERRCVTDVLGHRRMIGSVKRITTAGMRGSADIHILKDGHAIYCEVKIGRDRQSEAQKVFQSSVESAGGTYIIVKSFTDFIAKISDCDKALLN